MRVGDLMGIWPFQRESAGGNDRIIIQKEADKVQVCRNEQIRNYPGAGSRSTTK